jgi:hypothetical protein
MCEDKKPEVLKEQKKSKPKHLFQKGQSGNPAGKPKGVGIQGELRKKLNKNLPEILDRLIEQALTGDLVAIKLLLERGFPAKRSESYIDLEMPEHLNLAERVDYALNAATRGEIATEIVNELAKAAVLSNTLKTTAVGGTRVIELNAGQLVAPDMSLEVKEPKDD